MKSWWSMMVVLSSGVLGCSTMRMAVPEELQQQQVMEWPVGRNVPLFGQGTLSFGPYGARKYGRGWSSTTSLSIGPATVYEGSEPYEFQLHAEDAAPRPVACQSLLKGHDVDLSFMLDGLSAGAAERRLVCDIGAEGKLALAELPAYADPYSTKVVGRLRMGGVNLDVESTHRTQQGARILFAGFEIRHEQRTVAAVQTINGGHVWMAGDLAPEVRAGVAMVASSVLLHGHWNGGADSRP
ncbi:hypothetical protein [Archangium lipolyticum]|uniref:hypothetical protein n=1 Tax=Archangium lipolyticum TaxID=2970465 RepID=UPI002149F462|nr:hypothetical protein [Archangium lipolyticum]